MNARIRRKLYKQVFFWYGLSPEAFQGCVRHTRKETLKAVCKLIFNNSDDVK